MKLLFVIFLVALLVGCAKELPSGTHPERVAASTPVQQVSQQTTPSLTPDQPVETDSTKQTREEMSAKSKEVLGLAANRVRSMKYDYFGPETLPASYAFWIKDDKIKIELSKGKEYRINQNYYEYVYLDKKLKKAVVVCAKDAGSCDTDPQDISYTLYGDIKTPLDYLSQITSFEIVSTENLHSREVYRAESNLGMVWIDTYNGLPLQIEKDGKTVLRAEGIVINQVTDADVNYE